ncbi:UDP-N-acetylmuramoyl-L-alanyl-D-glutamate--2, 6-diaminopimelate ligase [Gammaproteobacteria bacterium]
MDGEKIKLKDLLVDTVKLNVQVDCLVTGIAIDSRKIQVGDLFLAYRGAVVDGRDFIVDAINRGAVAVLCEDAVPDKYVLSTEVLPIIVVPGLKNQISLIAAKFYGYPARKLTVIGVTGTNGKTSITQFIASVLTNLGVPCGVIGTIGVGFPGKLVATINTTPDPVTLQRWLFKLKKEGAQAVAMEVSSHSLVQQRVSGIDFKIAVFTNLTRDHLDYHGTVENYGVAKKMLFRLPGLQYAIINADDEFGQKLVKELKTSLKVYAYTTKDTLAEVPTLKAEDINLGVTGINVNVITPWGEGLLKSHLLGRFNLSNLLAVLAVLGVMKVNVVDALAGMEKLETVKGRMQTFGGDKKPLVVVDYAHTPDALEQALLVLRGCCRGAIWCVFGCGGDRDRGKRPMMGQIAERYSDHIIITNDNPRAEDPQQIISDILQGLLCPWAVEVEQDRRAAIAHAVDCAHENDVVLVAGKGHEDYQIIGMEKLPFSDQEVVAKVLYAKVG